MSPAAELKSGPHFSIWLVNGASHAFDVVPMVAVKSPELLVTVTEVVASGEELKAANVPFVHGVV
jgi:hypothetical protein